MANPFSIANSDIISITSIWIFLSLTTPFLPTFPFPASNCGFIKATISPSIFNNSLALGKTSFKDIKDTSIDAKSANSFVSSIVT